ncbi:MAG TPA: TetR/AcrR family transcriptional regulator [Frankiaceae bacterium]|nr:TetR/AcrR family transcriptional regulator [Frankiaceae bacterium]
MTTDAVPAPRSSRGEKTRAKLLDAARVAFAGVPWSRARVEDVCRAAGVGHGTYYAYFGSKSDIVEALVRRHADALYHLADADWTTGDVAADVRRVIAGFVALAETDKDIREVWFAAAPSEPVLAALVGEVRRQFVARIGGALTAARDAGLARADLDVDVAATALAAMVEQTVALAQQADGGSTERLVDGLTDLWVHAVYRG